MADKTFQYTATDRHGKKVKGKIDASNNDRAYQMLTMQGLSPIRVVDIENDVMQKEISIPGFEPKSKLKNLAIFCKQFALLIKSGIPMLEAVRVSGEQTEDKVLKKALAVVHADIENGVPLSVAMEKHPNAFPDLLVAIISVGEEGGFLDESLASMAKTYKTELELKRKVKSAMMYPFIVIGITALVVGALLIFVVPQFAEMFESMDAELPFITQILVNISKNMLIVVPSVLVALFIFVFFYRKYAKEEWLRSRVDKWKLKVPVFGNLNTKVAVARFTGNLGMMLSAGVPLIQALMLVSSTANNFILSKAIEETVQGLENGRSFSSSIEKFDMFPPMVKNMIVIGESSGNMSAMLGTVAEFYDEEVKEASENLAAAIEPLMILVLGVVIGGMLMALYMPMFSIMNTMSSGA